MRSVQNNSGPRGSSLDGPVERELYSDDRVAAAWSQHFGLPGFGTSEQSKSSGGQINGDHGWDARIQLQRNVGELVDTSRNRIAAKDISHSYQIERPEGLSTRPYVPTRDGPVNTKMPNGFFWGEQNPHERVEEHDQDVRSR